MLTAHQPNYLPYPGFFQKVASADTFLVVDTTQFVKRGPFGWIHRNRIRTPNGPIWLTLPVLSKGRYEQPIRETMLNPRVDWRRKHWRSIEFSYRRAPCWSQYHASLRECYEQSWTRLALLTTHLIRWFFAALDLDPELHIASELRANGKSTQYIIDFCQELGETRFLSGVHGREYLDVPRFEAAGIELFFQQYDPPIYEGPSGWTESEGCQYSMLDMLFWCGETAAEWVHAAPEVVPT